MLPSLCKHSYITRLKQSQRLLCLAVLWGQSRVWLAVTYSERTVRSLWILPQWRTSWLLFFTTCLGSDASHLTMCCHLRAIFSNDETYNSIFMIQNLCFVVQHKTNSKTIHQCWLLDVKTFTFMNSKGLIWLIQVFSRTQILQCNRNIGGK